jgi:hypothetical protein
MGNRASYSQAGWDDLKKSFLLLSIVFQYKLVHLMHIMHLVHIVISVTYNTATCHLLRRAKKGIMDS